MVGFFYRVYNAKVSSLSSQKTVKSEQSSMPVRMLPRKYDVLKFASEHNNQEKENLGGLIDVNLKSDAHGNQKKMGIGDGIIHPECKHQKNTFCLH